jgi:hypothetical protein
MRDAIEQYFYLRPEATPTADELVAELQTPRATMLAAIKLGQYPDLVYIYGPSNGKRGKPIKVICTRETAERIESGKHRR